MIGIITLQVGQNAGCKQQGAATTGNNTLLNGSAGGVQSIIHTVATLFHLSFRGATDANHRHTAGQFGQTLLQFFFVVIRRGVFDLGTDLGAAGVNVAFFAVAIDDGGVVLGDAHFFGCSQHVQCHIFQFDPDVFGNHFTASEDGNVFQHGFATITETRGFHSGHFQTTAQFVHHQCGEGFAFHIFSDNQQRTSTLNHTFQNGQQRLQTAKFFVVQQNERVVQLSDHFFGIGHEVWGQVAAIKLHPFHNIQLRGQTFGFFNSNDAFVAHFFHGAGDHFPDFFFPVGGNGAHLGNFFG